MEPANDSASARWDRVLAHRERLLRLARPRAGDDAEDIVQEAMLRCATLPGLDEDRVGPLLTSVVVRLCVDEHRRRVRASRLLHRLPVDRDEQPGVDEPVCARAEAAWAAGVLRTLSPMQQAVIEGRAQGLSYADISRRHRVSYKSVESAASRARAVVRGALTATLAAVAVARRPASAPVSLAAACTVVAGVVAGVVARPVPHPAVPRERVVTAAEADRPLRPRAAARTTGAAVAAPPLRQPAAPVTAGASAPRERRRPAAPPPPVAPVGKGGIGYDARHYEFTTQERVLHCVTYGVDLSPTIRCRYPDEGPGARPREPR